MDGVIGFGVERVPKNTITAMTLSMHIYDNLTRFERGRHELALPIRTEGGVVLVNPPLS